MWTITIGMFFIILYPPARKTYEILRLITSHLAGYRWQDGVIVHVDTLKYISQLESLTRTKQHTIEWLMTNPIKTERGGQLSFLNGVKSSANGANTTLVGYWPNKDGELHCYLLRFKNQLDRMRFTSDDYIWIERYLGKIGKQKQPKYDYRWVHIDEFDPRTDIKIMENFPFIPGSKTKYIPDKYLPFKWEYHEETEAPFSVEKATKR
jgi:hypothetical protein